MHCALVKASLDVLHLYISLCVYISTADTGIPLCTYAAAELYTLDMLQLKQVEQY